MWRIYEAPANFQVPTTYLHPTSQILMGLMDLLSKWPEEDSKIFPFEVTGIDYEALKCELHS